MDVTDRVCNLECIKDGKVHEFVGPVKIILMDPPPNEYSRRKTGAAFVAIANMMMGATTMTMLFFTLAFRLSLYNNLHVLLCTIGYQLCIPSGILMLHALNGPAAPLKKSDRRFHHIFLQIFGLACGIIGSILVFSLGKTFQKKSTYHFYAGALSGLLGLVAVCIAPFIYFKKKELTIPTYITSSHRLLGVLSFFLSSVCFILGLIKPMFVFWLPSFDIILFLIFFCLFYTVVVIITPLLKFKC